MSPQDPGCVELILSLPRSRMADGTNVEMWTPGQICPEKQEAFLTVIPSERSEPRDLGEGSGQSRFGRRPPDPSAAALRAFGRDDRGWKSLRPVGRDCRGWKSLRPVGRDCRGWKSLRPVVGCRVESLRPVGRDDRDGKSLRPVGRDDRRTYRFALLVGMLREWASAHLQRLS